MDKDLTWPFAFYGSLRDDLGGWQEMADEFGQAGDPGDLIGPCTIPGILHDRGRYPALTPGDGLVRAELRRIYNPKTLTLLDRWERYDRRRDTGLYVRRLMWLAEPYQRAWVYVYSGDVTDLPIIRSGDWSEHVHGQPWA